MDVRSTDKAMKSAADAFSARLHDAPDMRLARFMSELIGDLANLADRMDMSRKEMQAVIGFLTEVGETCSERRQEWVLLADVLGLSSAFETRHSRLPANATPNTLAGPFYRPGAPRRGDNESICLDGMGTPLVFTARVSNSDGEPLVSARIEVWHANGEGVYENQAPDMQPEFNLRGTYTTGPDGAVRIRTVRPQGYRIPDDGPVGKLLRKLGLPTTRPAHLQFRIAASGYQTLITHVFDRSDPAIGVDPLFAVQPALLADFTQSRGGECECAFTFILAGDEDFQKPT
ncbi:dioxygenase [Hoeflea sp. AS60]|uniref:dioxygenase family protein n=1 Tax=Hoeflea sp. AS60 TaxID=3135780 RepID=UPI0031716C5F